MIETGRDEKTGRAGLGLLLEAWDFSVSLTFEPERFPLIIAFGWNGLLANLLFTRLNALDIDGFDVDSSFCDRLEERSSSTSKQ